MPVFIYSLNITIQAVNMQPFKAFVRLIYCPQEGSSMDHKATLEKMLPLSSNWIFSTNTVKME